MSITSYWADKDGNLVDAAEATIPSDKHFRDAWSADGTVITEDLAAAKTIFADKIREARKPLLEALDTDYMKALETSSDTAAIVKDKQALRDAPTTGNSASTITELKESWPSCCGTSPYKE
jgi:hypothetical protein